MGATLDDTAVVQDHNAVGIADGAEAMGNDKGGTVLRLLFQSLLNNLFALVVQSVGCLVKNKDWRVL